MKMTPISPEQLGKILKALYYSAASGFSGGFVLSIAGYFQNMDATGLTSEAVFVALKTAFVIGGVVGALNSIAVTVKQLFTDPTVK